MTVKELLETVEKPLVCVPDTEKNRAEYKNLVLQTMEIWQNDACSGYAAAAAVDAGLDLETIKRLLEALDAAYDDMTIREAADFYNNRGYLGREASD